MPKAGFFIWLQVGDGKEAARKLWREVAIKTVPGELMARSLVGEDNPGQSYLRIALVYDAKTTELGLRKIENVLYAE